MRDDPFELDPPFSSALNRAAWLAVRPLLHWTIGMRTYRQLARERSGSEGHAFAAGALEVLRVRATCGPDAAAHIPADGPLIVAANHPHGALDGLLLLDLVGRVRQDVRLLANRMLACVPELRELCFFVDPFEGTGSVSRSVAGLRAAIRWVSDGGALIVFPAGEVGHARDADGVVIDSPWRATLGRLIESTRASVVPVHIDGSNSRLFYAAGRIHPLLRTVLLPRELLKSRGKPVRVAFGSTVHATDLTRAGEKARSITQSVRTRVERLQRGGVPVAPAVSSAALAREVDGLPPSAKLVESGGFGVYCAEASSIPYVLDEIGRLREVTFRAVGEGTGLPSDLDEFDRHYLHLFLWDVEQSAVVGAYRLGCTDAILPGRGVAGLYTRTLFEYDGTLFQRLPTALELGRSFVRAEYQRNHSALLLLWKGICAFIARHPRYRVLLGAVSISARYTDRTREMLMDFLRQNHLDAPLAELIRPRNPYGGGLPDQAVPTAVPRTAAEAEAAVSRLERNGEGMPVLLRQYLKLNARLLGFNVDPAFGDALDALMMVDLTRVDRRILRRYFGPAAADAYLLFHAGRESDAA
jgi:putative hemolysin